MFGLLITSLEHYLAYTVAGRSVNHTIATEDSVATCPTWIDTTHNHCPKPRFKDTMPSSSNKYTAQTRSSKIDPPTNTHTLHQDDNRCNEFLVRQEAVTLQQRQRGLAFGCFNADGASALGRSPEPPPPSSMSPMQRLAFASPRDDPFPLRAKMAIREAGLLEGSLADIKLRSNAARAVARDAQGVRSAVASSFHHCASSSRRDSVIEEEEGEVVYRVDVRAAGSEKELLRHIGSMHDGLGGRWMRRGTAAIPPEVRGERNEEDKNAKKGSK